MRSPYQLKSFSKFLRCTKKQHGISPRFAVETLTVQSTYNVALDSLHGQLRHLEQDSGMTPSMAFTASEVLKSEESETTLPIIERLHNITCPPP